MASLEELLQRWLGAGVVDAATAARIREFEQRSKPVPDTGQYRPGVLEAITYLGIVVAAVGASLFAAQQWDELESWVRIATVGVPAFLVLLAGFAMRSAGQPEIARAASVAWFAAVVLMAATAAVVFVEYDVNGENSLLYVGLVAVAAALPLWAIQRSHPQVLAVMAGLFLTAQGLGAWPDTFHEVIAGLAAMGFGALGLAGAETGRFTPKASAGLLSALMLAVGAFEAGLAEEADWAEALVFVAGGALIALSVVRANFGYMVVGVVAIFVGLIALISEHLSETVGAPVALMLSGAVLLAGVLVLARFRSHTRKST